MKKKYIIPRIEISICVLENFIAASPTGSGNVTVDDKTTDLKKQTRMLIYMPSNSMLGHHGTSKLDLKHR